MRLKFCIFISFVLCLMESVAQITYQVGDLFVDDYGNAGIVFYLLPDQTGGWVVALNDADSLYQWGVLGEDVPEIPSWDNNLTDTSGYRNTLYLRNSIQGDLSSYGVGNVDFQHGWYVPAVSQLTWLFVQLPLVESKFAIHGGTSLSDNLYLSSSEASATACICMKFSGGQPASKEKNTYAKLRPVRSFSYCTTHYDTSLTYQWNTGSTQPYINPSPQQTTTYTVTTTNESGCSATASQTVFVAENMPQEIYDEVCQGEPYDANGFTVTAEETATSGLITRTHTIITDSCYSIITLYLTVLPTVTTELTHESCVNYNWNGVTLYESGDYVQYFSSSNGCDSTVILHLTLYSPDTTYLTETACDSFILDGTLYGYSGTFTQYVTNSDGCDSVVILNLTVHPSQYSSIDTTVYNFLQWDDSYWTETGDYSVTYTNQFGCDSIVTIHLTVIQRDTTYIDSTVCDNALPFIWNGLTFNGAGTETVTLHPSELHDSVVVMTLHINPVQQTQFTVTTCDSYTWNDQTYTQSGSYMQEFVNQQGCDSIVTLHLSVLSSHHTDTALTVCSSYTWNSQTYTQSGTYTQEFVGSQGCDSTVTLTLTVNPSHVTSFDTAACNSFVWNGQSYTATGTYTQQLTNTYGCDSIVTVNLTIYERDTVLVDTLVCPQSFPVTVRGFTFTGAGTQTVTVPNVHGCDSTTTVHVSVSDTTTVTTAFTACNSYFWYSSELTESGVYEHTAINANGCPYTRRLTLTVHYSDTTYLDSTVCQNELPLAWNGRVFSTAGTQSQLLTNQGGCDSLVVMTVYANNIGFLNFDTTVCGQFEWAGSVYTQSGTYMKTFLNVAGCDSMVFAHVTVLPPSVTLFDTVVCSGDLPVTWHGTEFEHADTLTFSYTSAFGCDSTVTLQLRTADPDTVTLSLTACDLFEWDGDEYYEDDTVTKYFTNHFGCDSTVTVMLNITHSSTTEVNVTACERYVWNGTLYETSGNYEQILENAEGCDSVVTLHLEITNAAHTELYDTACNSYVWNGEVLSQSGDYHDTLSAANGCDSVATLHLTIHPVYALTEQRGVCEDELPYTWNGMTFTEAGTQVCTLQTVNGCDSVVTMVLHVSNRYELTEERTVCDDSLPYTWNGVTFTGADTQTATFLTTDGCDSVVTMTLHVSNSYHLTEERTVCDDSLPYIWNGVTFTGTGTQTATFQTADGCDSVVTMTLNVSNTYNLTEERTICEDSLPYLWNGVTFNGEGTQSITLQTADGCDSVISMTLHVSSTYQQTEVRTVCQDELPYTWNGVIFNNAGTQPVTMQTVNGCDSTITMILHVSPVYQQTEQRTICQNELPYLWNGVTFTGAGTQSVTLQTVDGCDSTITMTLHVSPVYQQTEQRTVCQDELPYSWNGVTFNNAGTQPVTLQTVDGCDSTITMTLHVSAVYQQTEQRTVCQDELPYSWNGKTFNSAGTQIATLQTVNGCDSTITMTLHVSNIYQLTESRTVCANNLPYSWNGVTFNGAETQVCTLQTVNGCDSVVTMTLAVADTNVMEVYVSACYSFAWNGVTYLQSGDYTETLSNSFGCDSVVTLHLTINNSDYTDEERVACNRYEWNSVTYTESGDYTSSLENIHGCDSVVTLHLTVIDTTLQIISLTEDFCEGMSAELVAVTGMTDYLWSTGEELPNITVTQPGLYSVTATQGGCHATAKYTVEACDFRLYLPNAITPSKSDGLNEVFCLPQRVQGMINDFEISIFNRWGEQVFYSTDKAFQWDGSIKGKTAVSTVYNYVIRCTVVGGKPYRFIGSVTVL